MASSPPPGVFESRLRRIARERPPVDLVENRVTFGAEDAEFSVYDTFRPAERVALRAPNPLYCGMVTGEKRVHTSTGDVVPFFPLESLVVPSDQTIHIDFPGASDERPTKCLTIEIDQAKVHRVAQRLNETAPRHADSGDWTYADTAVCHFHNPPGLERTVRKLVGLFVEDAPDKGLLIDLGVQELVVRMLRLEARRLLLDGSADRAATNGLAAAVEVAKRRLHERLTVGQLAAAACMSEATFFRHFQAEFGVTPLAYLTALRVRRAQGLLNRGRAVTDTAPAVGFASVSHFIRVFREHTGTTPKQYQLTRNAAA